MPKSPEDHADSAQSGLRDAVRLVLDEARKRGASDAAAAVSARFGSSVTVRLGEVETIEHQRDNGLGVTVFFGQRKGSASSNDLAPAALRDAVAAACSIARHTGEDPCAGLADRARLSKQPPELGLFHPWDLSPEQAIALALRTEDAARAVDPRITNSEGASLLRRQGGYVYGNSQGFLQGYPSSRHTLSCTVIAEDSDGMQRDHWYDVARDPVRLTAGEEIGRIAGRRSVRRLGARKLATRDAPVLFAAEVARGLFTHFVAAVSGPNLYRKASFLFDKIGEQVFPDRLRIYEQPHLRGALGSAPFDREGVATTTRDLVTDGVLRGYALDSYAARKLGLETTGNAGGVRNLTVAPGPLDREALLRKMGTGLLVTELLGMGVDIVTGNYSRGAVGYWVENGEICYPVEEITIAGRLAEMYGGIIAVGNDVDMRGNVRTGSILIGRMTIAGA